MGAARRGRGRLVGFGQWDPDDPEGEDVRIASAGRLSVIYFANRPLRHLSVLDIVWLGGAVSSGS
ncbi:hypothetical protein [Streptomyces sp. NBC_01207]|uniref:hypothetical protein n=1 Tax=Streptomyces sp. NBC_01207 TaxID=2903772 RepID=UPI002E0F7D6D|nr:hypothetical protein OG457_00315 [Streptomyces sp. NBC_01207]